MRPTRASLSALVLAAGCSTTAGDGASGSTLADVGESDTSEGTGYEAESDGSESDTSGEPKLDVSGKLDLGEGGDGDGIPTTCAQAQAGHSTVGCEFYAVDLDLVVVYDTKQYAVAVANVQLDQQAEVKVEVDDGNGWATVAGPESIAALELHTFALPDRHVDRSGVRPGGAYRISADVPIVAYQFEPLEAGESYTSDASLLYPTPAWDTLHYVLNQHKINVAQESYFTVVAAEDGTVVTVTPAVDTVQGVGVPAGVAGQAFEVELDDGDVLQVAIAWEGEDPTGTRVESNPDHPIAVFSGNTCALVPEQSAACDHLQDQMVGVRLWGQNFVAARMPVRSSEGGQAEASLWQIFANEADTLVETSAANLVTGLPQAPVMMQAGEVLELWVAGPFSDPGDFSIAASKPIAVANYMTGSSTVKPINPNLGDPSQVQLAPIEQFLPRYVVLVPDTWEYDVATVTRHTGTQVRIDDVAVADDVFAPVGDAFEVGRVLLADGVHVLDGDQPFSVVIVGYDDDDSYAYLGGAGTAVINPNPEG